MDPNQTINLNHNAAECIKSAARLTETFYQNICTGASYTVPYGGVDYILGSLLILALVAFILFLIGVALAITSEL